MADVFFSYAREDEQRIKELVEAVEGRGWSVFWDRRIPAGETWRSYIGRGLEGARCIIVGWSRHSIESQWVAEEADEGKNRNALVPVLLERVQPPHGFREIHAADLSDWHAGRPSQQLDDLMVQLERRLGTPSAPGPVQPRFQEATGSPPKVEAPVVGRSKSGPLVVAFAVVALVAAATVAYVVLAPERTPIQPAAVQPRPTPSAPALTAAPVPAAKPPATTVVKPTTTGDWLVIVGSFARADAADAERLRAQMGKRGFDAVTIDTNDYGLLTPNLWAVVIGPFDSKDTATDQVARVKSVVPDAYVKKGR